ncbi:hypothetical protein ACT3TI_04595 [Psychrobacter sp. AOP22-C1-22]|uniref:hypothetical protein n=1 Tax=unclassified Psychrobacter TaxID=196806 RepID=UPI0017886E89|nr:hypothetical protein [Psychrobacter sp. FME6]MBE0406068.1 hypothetical protein [Psychrobacter sp. FME6]
MSDKKNSHNSDLEANLAKIANTKPRKRMRKDNIYERFITRVENVDGVDDDDESKDTTANELKPVKDANKLSSYEPLSAAELALFATQVQEGETLEVYNDKGINLDFSDEDEDLTTKHVTITNPDESLDCGSEEIENKEPENHEFINEEVINEKISNKKSIKSKDKQASSKKPLVIGMVFGSLLIAAIVMMLVFTGVLSTSTKTDIANGAEIPVIAENNSDASREAEVVETIEQDTQPAADATAAQYQGEVIGSEAQPAPQPSNDKPADASITYEDFRQESQSTLYRETDD